MSLGAGNQPLKADALRKSLSSALKGVEKESEKLKKQQQKKERQDNIAYGKLEKEKTDLSTSLKSLQSIESEIADRIEAIGVTTVTNEGSKTSGEIGIKLESITAHEKALAEFKQDQERIRSDETSQIPPIAAALSKSRQDAAEALALSNAKMTSSNEAGISLADKTKLLKEAADSLQIYDQHNASVLASTKRLEQTRASITQLDKTQSKDLKAQETTTRAQTESLRKEITALQQERVELTSAKIQVQAQIKPLEARIATLENQQKDDFPKIHAERVAAMASVIPEAALADVTTTALKPPPPTSPFPTTNRQNPKAAPDVVNPIVDAHTAAEQREEPVVNAVTAAERREEPAVEDITPYMPSAPAIIQPSISSIAGPEAYEYLDFKTPKQTPENRVPPSLDQVAQTRRFLTDLSKHKNANLDLTDLEAKTVRINELMGKCSPEEMQNKINNDKDFNKAYSEWCIAGHEAAAQYHTNYAEYFRSTGQTEQEAIARANAEDARGHAQINRDILTQNQERFRGQEAVQDTRRVVAEGSAVAKPVAVEAAKPVIKAPVVAQEEPQISGSSPAKAPVAPAVKPPSGSLAATDRAKQAEEASLLSGLQAEPKTAKRIVPKPQEQPGRYGIAINRVSDMREEFSQNMKETLPVRMGGGKPRDPGGVGGR